ncbi:hypothetical protein GCM10010954_21240 [Halobacillus andaensis]|uniref:Uncharacterized protein n=1 Tax=Halobacillus andaensis TaxID=1176239 RepID=A0A917B4Z3_HALAA|nr:hypothetical protein GCM10010954_21240 [Halobacillus andaensis]
MHMEIKVTSPIHVDKNRVYIHKKPNLVCNKDDIYFNPCVTHR